jgi:predicted branched-subunit amino acid permease
MLATRTAAPTRTWGRDVVGGVRAMAPWLLGIGPYGLVIGVGAAHSGIPTGAGLLTGPAIYSGSAQVATIELLGAGAAPWVVIATALAINARLVVYSGAMATHWRDTPRWWRAIAAYLLVDPSFAVGVARYDQPGDRAAAHRHYLGGAVALWVAWLAAMAVGATAGARLPAGVHLEFVIPLFLVGEVAVRLTSRAMRRAALTAAVVAVLGYAAPLHTGVVAAIALGIAAGLLTPEVRR